MKRASFESRSDSFTGGSSAADASCSANGGSVAGVAGSAEAGRALRPKREAKEGACGARAEVEGRDGRK
jgi:hypothetical protein